MMKMCFLNFDIARVIPVHQFQPATKLSAFLFILSMLRSPTCVAEARALQIKFMIDVNYTILDSH